MSNSKNKDNYLPRDCNESSFNCQNESPSRSIKNLSPENKTESVQDCSLSQESDAEICKIHNGQLKLYICWEHQEKICHECVIFGKHRNYECTIGRLEDLNQRVGPVKTYCEDLLPKLTIFYEKTEKCYEEQTKSTLKIIQNRFSELRFMLNAKEAEFIYEINSFNEKELDKLHSQIGENSLARQILQRKILEYEQITQNLSPFELLEENLSPTFELIQTAVDPANITKIEQMLEQIKQCIDQTLSEQLSTLEKMTITTKEDVIWRQEPVDFKLDEKLSLLKELEEESLSLAVFDPVSIEEMDIQVNGNTLSISFPFQKNREKNLHILKEIEIDIDSLTLNIHQRIQQINKEEIITLCYVRNKMISIKNIEVHIQESCNISDDALLNIFSCIFIQNHALESIFLIYRMDGSFDKTFSF